MKRTLSRVKRSPRRPAVPGEGLGGQLVEEPIVQRVGHLLAGLEDQAWVKPVQHAGNPAEVVRVRMGDDCEGQLPRAVARQERHDHPAAGVAAIVPGSGVDHHPASCRGAKDRAISLPYVEKM